VTPRLACLFLLCATVASCAGRSHVVASDNGSSAGPSSLVDDGAVRVRAVDMAGEVLRSLSGYQGHPWESLRSMSHPVHGLTIWIDEGATPRPSITVFQDRDTVDARHGFWTTGEFVDAWPSHARRLLEWGIPRMTYPDAEGELPESYAVAFHNRESDSRLLMEAEYPEYIARMPEPGGHAARPPDVDLLIRNYDSLRMYFTVHADRLYLSHMVLQMGAS
jgi:hypothetical protein